jgi:secreted PhoX family phosphatase
VVKDYQDNVIRELDSSAYLCNGTDTGKGSGLDHFSFLQKNGKVYMVSQFECGPGAMYMNELEQASDGKLTVKADSLQFISQKGDFGGWVHCAGMTTPWNSHLGSEEYPADANPAASYPYTANSYYSEVTNKYWGGNAAMNNPYYYGWTPEVTIGADGTPNYTKHYSMGRFAHELAYVMPDKKTVYLSDDGTNVGLFMFVADTAEDLSAGTLYAAKWVQTSSDGSSMGQAVIKWINLGHATDAAIKTIVATKPAFSSIFATEAPQGDGSCATAGFVNVNTEAGNECLKLQDVNGDTTVDAADEAIAARLETRRMAAYKGATTEFRKEEGITFNQRDNKLYIAMSEVAYGMESNAKKGVANTTYDLGGNNDIRVEYNPCGAVYALDVATNSTIGSDYVAYSMKGLVSGTPVDYSGTALEGNTCDVDGIASPDNVTFLQGSDILVIGEDTSAHPNDMVWAYNIKDGSMERIFTGPYGSETTSPFWHKDINGFGYLTVTTQHPFGEVSGSYTRPAGVETKSEAGYIGPFDFSDVK